MANSSFLPDLPALRANPVGDDAGEDEGHPDHDGQVGEVLPEREAADQLVVDRVEDGVGEQIEEQAGRHDDGSGPGENRDREPCRDDVEGLRDRPMVLHARLLVWLPDLYN
jgi:hypothetical protein